MLNEGGHLGEASDYLEPPEAGRGLTPAVTAEQAIGDLPAIDARAQLRSGELRRGARRFDVPMPMAAPVS